MQGNLSAKGILLRFYDEDSDLFRLLWKHSCQVAEMAADIAGRLGKDADAAFVYDAALLHDIGIFRTHAPSIFCTGEEPYIKHGTIGSTLLREIGLDRHALVCERHTGAGLSRSEIIAASLPLPCRDMMPESIEEKIVCYADKFFSKSNVNEVKTADNIRKELSRFGEAQVRRFNEMDALFNH